MRRSKAPSASQNPVTHQEGIINILQSSENHVKELNKIGASKQTRPEPSIGNVQKFRVVFGKSSTKKHKTFSEDGTLEINQSGVMILKNSAERIVTMDSKARQGKVIEEGLVMAMGGYDVQIDEKIEKSDKHEGNDMARRSSMLRTVPSVFKSPLLVSAKDDEPETFKKCVYTVVYGPVTTKKHKTFDEDGTLEVEGKVARLKDTRGRLVATYFKLKSEDIRDGDRLIIEGKEVEIVELQESGGIKRGIEIEEQTNKKFKGNKTFVSPVLTYMDTGPGPSFEATREIPEGYYYGEESDQPFEEEIEAPLELPTELFCDAPNENYVDITPSYEVPEIRKTIPGNLIMPVPPYDHQFKYNTSNGPVQPIFVPEFINSHLREHQRDGIRFLYECVMGFYSVNDVPIEGAILADEMGLGKTIQTIALIYMLLKQNPYSSLVPVVRRILVVTNSSLVDNWKNEIEKWLKHQRIYSFEVTQKNKPSQFANSIHIPIMIISYESLVKQIEEVKAINFDIVVCDEGHKLKNVNTHVASRLNELSCKKRIVLTGTPIQNNLEELFALVDFVNPGILGSYGEFKTRYENPIVQSQQAMVLPQYKELGLLRQQELFSILSKFVLRRTQDVLKQFLPMKQEVVVVCAPSQLQRDLYTYLLSHYQEQKENLEKTVSPLQLITVLKKICNQPSLLTEDKNSEFEFLRKKLPSASRLSLMDSSKLEAVFFLLESLKDTGERIVLVSNYNKTLDILMQMCRQYEFNFVRLDGSTAITDRAKAVKFLNDPSSDAFVFLLSAKAGGTGLNLIGASRLVLYDNDWNPATDTQALSRIWRDGQTRKVYIYRLITANTIEEKIFQRQMTKTSLGGCVMECNIKQKSLNFTNEELKALFTVPENFDTCNTHEMLQCSCAGFGEIPDTESSQESLPPILNDDSDDDDDSPFKIRTKKQMKSKKNVNALQMHELMQYEHYMAPIEESLLEELCLKDAIDIIKFIFRNVTDNKTRVE